jgi:undecaprenyl-diphosphatase
MRHFAMTAWSRLSRLGRSAPWLLLLFGLSAALVLMFGRLTEEVIEGDADAFDRNIIGWFRDSGHVVGPPWLQDGMRDITALGSFSVLVLILALVLGYLLAARLYSAALFLFGAVASGQILSTLLKVVIDRSRPELLVESPIVHSASFPSGHAMLSAVTYLTLGALLTRIVEGTALKAYCLTAAGVLTMLVGISRVYLGAHWPSDVLAGWCVGSAWALLCWGIALRLESGGKRNTRNF